MVFNRFFQWKVKKNNFKILNQKNYFSFFLIFLTLSLSNTLIYSNGKQQKNNKKLVSNVNKNTEKDNNPKETPAEKNLIPSPIIVQNEDSLQTENNGKTQEQHSSIEEKSLKDKKEAENNNEPKFSKVLTAQDKYKNTPNKERDENQGQYRKVPGSLADLSAIPKSDAKLPQNAKFIKSVLTIRESINQFFFLAFLAALHKIKTGEDLFFSANTPKEIKELFSPYVTKTGIYINKMRLSGLMDNVAGYTGALNITFDMPVSYFYNFFLRNEDKFPNNVENILNGKISISEQQKLLAHCETQSSIFLLHHMIANIMSFLSIADFAVGTKDFEKRLMADKKRNNNSNIGFLYRLQVYRNFLAKRNPAILQEAKSLINSIVVIKIPNSTISSENTFNQLSYKFSVGKDSTTGGNHNIYAFAQTIGKTPETVDLNTLPNNVLREYFDYLTIIDEDVAKLNFFSIFDTKNNTIYIIPRFNPLNEWRSKTIISRFTDKKNAIVHCENLLINKMIDSHIMDDLIKNGRKQITIKYTYGGKEIIQSIDLEDFIKRMKIFSFTQEGLERNNPVDIFFSHLQKIFKAAFLEASFISKNRESFLERTGSETSDIYGATITVDSLSITGLEKPLQNSKSRPVVITFSNILNFLSESFKSGVIHMTEVSRDLENSDELDNKQKTEIMLLTCEALMKSLVMTKIKKSVIRTLLEIDNEKKITKSVINNIKDISNNMNLNQIYLERLLYNKRKELTGIVESKRNTVYCITFGCNNQDVVNSYISTIKDEIKSMGNDYKIENLRDRLTRRGMIVEFKKTAFLYLPMSIAEEYNSFLLQDSEKSMMDANGAPISRKNAAAADGDSNFFVGKYNNYQELKSGLEFVLYIIPKYDERNNGLPGYFQENIAESEISALYNTILYPYIQDTFQRNQDISVTITSIVPGELGLRSIVCKLSKFNAALNLETFYKNYFQYKIKRMITAQKATVKAHPIGKPPVTGQNQGGPMQSSGKSPLAGQNQGPMQASRKPPQSQGPIQASGKPPLAGQNQGPMQSSVKTPLAVQSQGPIQASGKPPLAGQNQGPMQSNEVREKTETPK